MYAQINIVQPKIIISQTTHTQIEPSYSPHAMRAAKFIMFNEKFLVFNTNFIIFKNIPCFSSKIHQFYSPVSDVVLKSTDITPASTNARPKSVGKERRVEKQSKIQIKSHPIPSGRRSQGSS